jgi:hypothetical protein
MAPKKKFINKFAVIIADPNSSELGSVVSYHKTRAGAEKSLAKTTSRWAYISHRQPDGEWEYLAEAYDRRRRERNEAMKSLTSPFPLK